MYKKGRVNSNSRIISTDEDPSLRIESSAIINLRGVSTKLSKYIVFTMQTYKKLNKNLILYLYFFILKKSEHKTSQHIEDAWAKGFTGKNVTVVVIDDGVRGTHYDLRNRYVCYQL